VASVSPELLSIRIDQLITRTVPLTVEVTGNVPFSFEAGMPQVMVRGEELTEARVIGPQGRVERVARVHVTADIDRLTANYNSPRPLEPVSADGQVVAGVAVEPVIANVQVPIVSSAGIKRVPIVPRVVGEPASGYVVAGVSVEPQFVTLTGSSGPLDQVQNIETQGVDISGANATITRTVALQEPGGARLRFGEPVSATVTVRITPIARPFRVSLPVPVEVINQPAGLLVSVNPQFVQVTLGGPAQRLSAIDPQTIVGTIDLSGFDAGVYSLAPAFTLPPDITLEGEPPQVTVVLRAPPTEVPPTVTPAPTETLAPTETPAELPTETPTQAPVDNQPPAETPTPTPPE
jgi:YbbR domain-containing protein